MQANTNYRNKHSTELTYCPSVLDVVDMTTLHQKYKRYRLRLVICSLPNETKMLLQGTVRDAIAEDRMRYRSVLTSPSVEVVVDKTDAQRRAVAVQRLP